MRWLESFFRRAFSKVEKFRRKFGSSQLIGHRVLALIGMWNLLNMSPGPIPVDVVCLRVALAYSQQGAPEYIVCLPWSCHLSSSCKCKHCFNGICCGCCWSCQKCLILVKKNPASRELYFRYLCLRSSCRELLRVYSVACFSEIKKRDGSTSQLSFFSIAE